VLLVKKYCTTLTKQALNGNSTRAHSLPLQQRYLSTLNMTKRLSSRQSSKLSPRQSPKTVILNPQLSSWTQWRIS